MAISQILLKNIMSTGQLAISGVIGSRVQQVQLLLSAGQSKDVSASVSLADLNRNAEIQHLISAGALQIIPVPGTQGAGGDIPGMPGVGDSTGRQVAITQHFNVTAGVGAVADDVTIYSASSPRMRILDASFIVTTAGGGGSTITLRTATGGGGSAVSDAFSTASTGYKRTASLTASQLLTAGSTLVLRRSDNTAAGELLLSVELS